MPQPPRAPRARGWGARGALCRLGACLLLGLAVGGTGLRAAPPAREPAVRRVVLLVLGGGVRASDLLARDLMPGVAAHAAAGLRAEALPTQRETAWLGLRDLLTGREDEPAAAGRPGTLHPTLFEALRAQPGVRAEDAWLVDASAGEEPGLACSSHPSFGRPLAARTAAGEGSFGTPLAPFLEQVGRPLPVEEPVWPLLRRLREVNRQAAGPFLPPELAAGLAEGERVERAVLAEIDRKAAFIKAASVGDEQATRAALTVLGVHRPRLLVLRLVGAEAGQQGVPAYEEALRQADQAYQRLRAAVAADPVLAASTVLGVATETGRNARAAASGALGMDEEGPARRQAACFLVGPGLKAGCRPKAGARPADVAPTLARLLGCELPGAQGRAWEECLPR
ncbi:MAG: hypothetical protein ACKOSS_04485 [Planctomycetia bacterium]